MEEKPQALYLAGYEAFDQGDFSKAISLATRCLEIAAPDSYWYSGSLGLRCWAASYTGDDAGVERDAGDLLARDSGPDRAWFEGLALLNLGLVYRRAGNRSKAKQCYARASERYAAYQIQPDHPPIWGLIVRFFTASTHWAAYQKRDKLKELALEMSGLPTQDAETQRLMHAVELLLRHAQGQDVRVEAEKAASDGVSRTFLVQILLESEEHRNG
jgi:tetratricopeptide (TPR) repeat protein